MTDTDITAIELPGPTASGEVWLEPRAEERWMAEKLTE